MSLLSAVTRSLGRMGLTSSLTSASKAPLTRSVVASSRNSLGSGAASQSVSSMAPKNILLSPSLGAAGLLRPLQPLRKSHFSIAPLGVQVRTFASRRFHKKKIIRLAKGYRGRTNCYRIAIRRVEKAWQYAYRDRKNKKREMRKLWIERLNAGVRQHGVTYSKFINMLHKSGVGLNRRMLADLAGMEPFSFKAVVDVVKMRTASEQVAQKVAA